MGSSFYRWRGVSRSPEKIINIKFFWTFIHGFMFFRNFPIDPLSMNIKGVFGNVMTNPVRPADKVERSIKSDMTQDRDANGQQSQQDGQRKHDEPMSDEQLQKSLEHLRQLPAVKENNWQIELTVVEGKRFVLVLDSQGTHIRRFPESDLWTLPVDLTDHKGQLLKKTA